MLVFAKQIKLNCFFQNLSLFHIVMFVFIKLYINAIFEEKKNLNGKNNVKNTCL